MHDIYDRINTFVHVRWITTKKKERKKKERERSATTMQVGIYRLYKLIN